MRKLLFSTFLLGVLLLSGCEHYLYDFMPVNVYISVKDGDGNNLLDPHSEYFIGSDISVEYRGKIEHLKPLKLTKEFPGVYSGLELVQKDGAYILSFGELDGGETYDDDFVVTWPDGSSDTIHYKRRFKHRLGTTPDPGIKEIWKLNGNETSNPVVIIK